MALEKPIECTPGPGCAVGAAVVQVARDVENLRGEVEDDRGQARQGIDMVHRRIDRVEDRFHAILAGVALTFLSSVVSIVMQLMLRQ